MKKTETINVRINKTDKDKLKNLAKKKGCNGFTSFLNMLAKAKKIIIKM